jgi:hypothetical protein
MNPLTATLNVRVPDSLRVELERQARVEQRRVSDLHRLLLEDALARRAAKGRRGRGA